MKIIEETKLKMKAALEHFKGELRTIRTGRASPGMVEHVSVEAYGSLVPLKSLRANKRLSRVNGNSKFKFNPLSGFRFSFI